ncbi:MAG: hypothetical protein WCG66_06495 [bacterium]
MVDVGDNAKVARILDSHEKAGSIRHPRARVNLKLLAREARPFSIRQMERCCLFEEAMPDSHPSRSPGAPDQKFRINSQVFQMLGLLAVALALPITVLVLGLSGIRKSRMEHPKASQQSEKQSEFPGLRESLESIAEVKMPIAPVEMSMRHFRLRIVGAEQQSEISEKLLSFFKQINVIHTETEEPSGKAWIASASSSQVEPLDLELLRLGFTDESQGTGIPSQKSDASHTASEIYKITLQLAP